jgi:hypothetical protein
VPNENSDPQSVARTARTLPWRDCETLPLKLASEASDRRSAGPTQPGVTQTALIPHGRFGLMVLP